MAQTTKPEKQVVREWMQHRQVERKPPPTPEQIRRELGWVLLKAEREAMPR